jgi:hypothetical protein
MATGEEILAALLTPVERILAHQFVHSVASNSPAWAQVTLKVGYRFADSPSHDIWHFFQGPPAVLEESLTRVITCGCNECHKG